MSEELPVESEAGEDAAIVEVKPGKAKRKKLIVIAAAAAVLLLGGGGAGYMMLGGNGAKAEAGHGEAGSDEEPAYVDVPAMTLNLRSPDGQARFLKLHFTLVAAEAGKEEEIKGRLPLILDAYQPFLRELRPEDLAGSAAVFRLKEELLVRAAGVLGQGVVKDVLIQDLVQQ